MPNNRGEGGGGVSGVPNNSGGGVSRKWVPKKIFSKLRLKTFVWASCDPITQKTNVVIN